MVKNTILSKAVFAIVAVATAGVVGGVNYANAQGNNGVNNASKPTKAECAATGAKNYGQCVSQWAQNKNGYGRTAQ